MLPILFRIGSADAFPPVQTNDKSELGDKIRMIRLQEVKAEDRKLLLNINQKQESGERRWINIVERGCKAVKVAPQWLQEKA